MSSIAPHSAYSYGAVFERSADKGAALEAARYGAAVPPAAQPPLALPLEDSVTISEDAYNQLYTAQPQKTEAEKQALTDTVKACLEKLAASRKDLTGHIDAILKKNGIRLAPSEKLRIETTAGGRIAVGGIRDVKKRKAIEEALNREDGLSKKIQAHQSTERKLNSNLKYETGKTAAGLLSELNGGENAATSSIPARSVAPRENLGHYELFAENPEFADMLREMGAESAISISSEIGPNAEPEATLTKSMRATHAEIGKSFEENNRKFRAQIEKSGVEVDPDFNEKYMLNLSRVTIRVGSDGSIEIDGALCSDSRRDKEGKEIIESFLKDMMKATDESGEVVLFEEASRRLLEDYQDAFGRQAADDARVMVEIGRRNPGAEVRLSSPSKEAELREDIEKEVNVILADMGISPEAPFEVAVEKDGKLRVLNPPDDPQKRNELLQAMKVINARMRNGDENDPQFGALARLLRHREVFQWGGVGEIYKDRKPITEVTRTDYAPAAGLSDPHVMTPI